MNDRALFGLLMASFNWLIDMDASCLLHPNLSARPKHQVEALQFFVHDLSLEQADTFHPFSFF